MSAPGTVSRVIVPANRRRCRQVPQADRTVHHAASRGTWGEHHQRDADHVHVEAERVAEVAMVAECFPMVRRDDHHGVVEKPLAS